MAKKQPTWCHHTTPCKLEPPAADQEAVLACKQASPLVIQDLPHTSSTLFQGKAVPSPKMRLKA
jgi:hypothetical protein